jgi:predicted NBD/HSP70 family sugar kinase
MRTLKISKANLHAQIVGLVRGGQAESRAALAKLLKVAPSTMSLYVDQLIAAGWMKEAGLVQGKTGRPKVRLALDPKAGWFAGLEFTASRVQVVAVDFAGQAFHSQACPIPSGADAETVIRTLQSALREAAKPITKPLLGIGVGVPGLVDTEAGVCRYSVIFPSWRDVPLQKVMQKAFRVPVRLENNLRVIALAERWFGGGRDAGDYVVLGPRSGFALAHVRDGRLTAGVHRGVGEVGLWPWPFAGGTQQVHQLLSAPATWRRLAGKRADAAVPSDLIAAVTAHAEDDSAAWHAVVDDFARVVGMTHLLIDAGIYFLHGPLVALGGRFCEAISQRALELMPVLKDMPLKVVPTTLGDNAGGLGAASLVMEAWDPGLGD